MNRQLSRFYREHLHLRIPALFALVLLACFPPEGIGFSLCPFALLTGIPCPACGLVRSLSSLLDFEVALSISYHPLGLLALGLIILCLVTNRTDSFRLYLEGKNKLLGAGTSPMGIGILFALVWIARLIHGFGDLFNS